MNEQYPALDKETIEKQSSPIFDPMIDQVLIKYMNEGRLTNAERENFKLLNRGDQVDEACWDYCSTNLQEETNKAVNLRSLYAVRSIDVASNTVIPGSEWKYDVPVFENPFWGSVDRTIFAYLGKYADARVSSQPIEAVSEDGNIIESEQIVANINEHDVLRRMRRNAATAQPSHVEYVVVASSKKR